MNLPANLRILPGVMQLANGKLFRYGEYPSGKRVMVPYQPNGAEPARMIPLPAAQPQQQSTAPRKPTLTLKRKYVVNYVKSSQENKISAHISHNSGASQEFVDHQLRPLSRFDGKNWHPIEDSPVWFQQWVDTEKEPVSGL